MIFKLKTSKSTMIFFEEISTSTHLQPFILAKLALALVIRNGNGLNDDDFKTDSDGLELNRQTITGEYDELFKALIINDLNKAISDEDYFPKYMKAYLDKGAKLLYSEFKYSGRKFYHNLLNLDNSI